jgi:hypothetical protein
MRYVIGLSFAALAVWVLQATGILMAIMMFLMIGQVPGTPVSLPPTVMMVLLVVLTLGVTYWLFRQRPVRQIQEMKRAYHQQVDESVAKPAAAKERRESLFMAGFSKSYASTWAKTYQWRRRVIANSHQKAKNIGAGLVKLTRPVRLFIVALSMIVLLASREITNWAKPHIRATAKWLRKQAGYSLKGTMLSAHRWSSLNKKLFSSLTSLLRRCNSVLKRGKSLLIRSAR